MIYYHSDSNYLQYAPIQIKLAISAGCAFLIGILFAYSYNSISPAQGEMESFGEFGNSGVVHFKCSRKFPKNLLN